MSPSTTYKCFSNTSRDGDSTTSLGSLFQSLTTLLEKKYFLMFNLISSEGGKSNAKLFSVLVIYLWFSDVCFVFFQIDLVNTIGESAALGAAGVVLWGSMQYASSKVDSVDLLLLRNHFNTSSVPPHPS